MLTPEPCVVPQRITIRLQDPDGSDFDAIAQVEWQIKEAEGYLCGCSFANGRSYNRLCKLTEVEPKKDVMPEPEECKSSSRESLWVALAVLFVFIFPSLFVLSREVAPATSNVAERSLRSTAREKADSRANDRRILVMPPLAREAAANENLQAGKTPDMLTEVHTVQPTQNATEIETVPFEYRTWIDSTGRHRVVARLLAVEGDTVRLQREDGRLASIAVERLSSDDEQYVRQRLANAQ